MAATNTMSQRQPPEKQKRDGITTCGYFDGNQNQPFVCPDTYSCTLYPFGAWWGCVNAVHNNLADTCFDADNAQPNRGDALNCLSSSPYCNTLYLESGVVTMSTWTCGTTPGTSYLLHTFTGAGAVSTKSGPTASLTSQTPSSALPSSSISQMPSSTLPSGSTPSPQSSSGGVSIGVIVGPIIGVIGGIIVAGLGYWGYRTLAMRKERFDERQARERQNFEMLLADRARRG